MEMDNRLQPSLDSGNGDVPGKKQLFGGSLTLRDYDGQGCGGYGPRTSAEQMTKAGMPESVRIA